MACVQLAIVIPFQKMPTAVRAFFVESYVNLPMLSVIQVLYSEIVQTAAVRSSRNVMIFIYLLTCLTQTKGLVVVECIIARYVL